VEHGGIDTGRGRSDSELFFRCAGKVFEFDIGADPQREEDQPGVFGCFHQRSVVELLIAGMHGVRLCHS
jgi:hypothetical protein